MEDYLKEFGISPQEFGIERYFKTKPNAEKSDKTAYAFKPFQNMAAWEHKFCDTKLKNLPIAMAYVPFQKIEKVFTEEEALKSGTLFTNLDKPFLGKRI